MSPRSTDRRPLLGLSSSTPLLGLMVATLLACEQRAVIGEREVDDVPVTSETDASEQDLPRLDVPAVECEDWTASPCDALDDDPLHAIGLDCIGGIPAAGSLSAHEDAWRVFAGTLGPGTYPPREGDKFLILSTGRAAQLPLTQEQLDCIDICPSTDLGLVIDELPAPLDTTPVDDELDCFAAPELVGKGDCSNSLAPQWDACKNGTCEAQDYAELRVGMTVPDAQFGLAFDFAFLSVEWPDLDGAGFNDMFIAWLESEQWTGNMSFDAEGNPISINASFLDYQGSAELEGFAMEGHAGTRWLTTNVGVRPGESVVLVLAVLDLGDGNYDSAVLLDALRWTCGGASPITQPVP